MERSATGIHRIDIYRSLTSPLPPRILPPVVCFLVRESNLSALSLVTSMGQSLICLSPTPSCGLWHERHTATPQSTPHMNRKGRTLVSFLTRTISFILYGFYYFLHHFEILLNIHKINKNVMKRMSSSPSQPFSCQSWGTSVGFETIYTGWIYLEKPTAKGGQMDSGDLF